MRESHDRDIGFSLHRAKAKCPSCSQGCLCVLPRERSHSGLGGQFCAVLSPSRCALLRHQGPERGKCRAARCRFQAGAMVWLKRVTCPRHINSGHRNDYDTSLPKIHGTCVCCCSCFTLTPDVYVRVLESAKVGRGVLFRHGNCFFSCSATFFTFLISFVFSGGRMDLYEHLLGVRLATSGRLCGRRGFFQ